MIRKVLNKIIYKYKTVKVIDVYNKIIVNKINELKRKKLFSISEAYHNAMIKKFSLNDYSSNNYFDFYYSVSKKDSNNYIPAPTYLLFIEPILNNRKYAAVISDKNYYEENILDVKTPETFLRKINGQYYDKYYNKINLSNVNLMNCFLKHDKLILKASLETGSGAGKNIDIFLRKYESYYSISKNEKLSLDYLSTFPDFIIQEVIMQYDFFKQFNPESNNTLRILTYRSVKDDSVHVLHRLFRVGKKGSFLDHDNLGGIVIGINSKGELNEFGTDNNGNRYYEYNSIKLASLKKVPYIIDVEKVALRIASRFRYVRLLAIDFSVDEIGSPILFEINTIGNGTCQYQMNNGALFGDFTEEILKYCSAKIDRFKAKIVIQ